MSKMSVDDLVKRVEQGADPKAVVEGYMVPNFEVGNRVLVQGLPSPLSGKVIALKEDGDLCTIETEKGTMDVPARHLAKQEGLKHEQPLSDLLRETDACGMMNSLEILVMEGRSGEIEAFLSNPKVEATLGKFTGLWYAIDRWLEGMGSLAEIQNAIQVYQPGCRGAPPTPTGAQGYF